MQTTLILIKPDAVQRGLVGRIISRFEDKGLAIVAAKLMRISPELAARHYEAHQGKPFYDGLVSFMTSSPVVAMAVRGDNAIAICRRLMGATKSAEAEPGTIRGDFGLTTGYNLVHGADSPEAADRELGLFFKPEEILDYDRTLERWLVE